MDSKHFSRSFPQVLEELESRVNPSPFTQVAPFTAGINLPNVVVNADLNGDGFSDAVIGNAGNDSAPFIGIALSKGDGTFTAEPSLIDPDLQNPTSIAVADFNKDGKLDIVVASYYVSEPSDFGSLLIWFGNGDGTFGSAQEILDTPVNAVGVADFNGDGNPDIVALNPDNGTTAEGYQILLGKGDGTFTALSQQSLDVDINRVVTGDFDGDGKMDFAGGNDVDNFFIPMFGDGTGNFSTPAPGFVDLDGATPTDLLAADFNNDGFTDLVVATNSEMRFYPGNSTRDFSSATFIQTYSGNNPIRLASADVNHDGFPDIIDLLTTNQTEIYLSDGSGGFTKDPTGSFNISGVSGVDIAAGDINGDSLPDFMVAQASFSGSQGTPFINQGLVPTVTTVSPNPATGTEGEPTTFTATVSYTGKPYPPGVMPSQTLNFEIDGEGPFPVSLVNGVATYTVTLPVGSHTIVAHYLGDMSFAESISEPLIYTVIGPNTTYQYVVTGLPTLPGIGGERCAVGVFRPDGPLDIVIGTGTGRSAEVTVIDGATNQTVFDLFPFGRDFTGGVLVAAGDIDGDGVADLAVAADVGGGPRVRIYLTRGNTLVPGADFFALDENFRGGLRVALGDMNGDGHADLVVTGGPGAGPRVATYDGTTLLAGQTPTRLWNDFFALDPSDRNGLFVAVGDLNGDGKPEIAVSSDAGGGPRVLIFDGEALNEGRKETLADFFVGDPDSRGGVRIAIRNVQVGNDGPPNFIAGDGPTAGSHVRVYSAFSILTQAQPVPVLDTEVLPGYLGGVYVA